MRLPSLLALLLSLTPAIRAAVLAIDYGAEFTKLSLVKPGVPFDVVLDKDSKRKVQSVVGWKRDDRVFGAEGKMAATRFPNTHYPYVKPLLGSTKVPSLPVYPVPPNLSPDGTLVFPHQSVPSHLSPYPSSLSKVWTPTDLLAHQLSYFRHLAELLSPSEPINQVIVTVPAWWNQAQRRAYRDALELQGLTCLAMIGEGTGVALNYAMTRTFPDYDPTSGKGSKEYHLVYDSGAMSTTATVVAFYQTSVLPTPKAKTPINTTHVEVLGTGWEDIGGVVVDLTIQEILAADFVQKSGKSDVREDKKAMAKLAREAVRVKHILSANQESSVSIESLFEDVDYRSRMSRSDLESTLTQAAQLFAFPVTSALQSANVSLTDLTSIILFGGNTRVPLVQSAIRNVLPEGDDRIAQNVNTDEAAVLGAAYWGASLSRQFKMKSLDVVERSVFDLRLGDEVIFPKGSPLGEKKALAFPAEDLNLEFSEEVEPILSVSVVDVATTLANFSSVSPMINLTMRLDPRGHLSAANAQLVSNATVPKDGGIAGALSGFFGSKDKDKELDTEDLGSPKAEKVALRFREKHLGVKPMTGEEKRTTMARLTSVAAFEEAKTARETARNLLEGYLYRVSGLLDANADNRALRDFSTEMERDALSKSVATAFDWLHENAEQANEKTLRSKRGDLEKLEQPIITRFTEFQTRGKAIEDFQQVMFTSRAFFGEAQKNNTVALEAAKSSTPEKPVAPAKYTEDELKSVQEMLKDNEEWMDELMTVQVKLEADKWRDPVIFTKDLNDRGKRLQMTCLRLINKKQPRAPRPSTSTSNASGSPTDASATTESAGAGTTSPIEVDPMAEATPSSAESPEVAPHVEL